MTIDELMKVIDYNDFNVTFSGGDPLYQADKIVELARRIKASGKTIWCYTGFTYEEVRDKAPYKDLLAYVDVLVDGPFIEAQRNIELRFRGSENQRIIDLNNTQPEKITILR
jgi:anaerobic ribonucleoside-triphosphate reductase activating protein